jgi:hypothetical protein
MTISAIINGGPNLRHEHPRSEQRLTWIDTDSRERFERFKAEFRPDRMRKIRAANRRFRRSNGLSLRRA